MSATALFKNVIRAAAVTVVKHRVQRGLVRALKVFHFAQSKSVKGSNLL
jgi:hypothetical protein